MNPKTYDGKKVKLTDVDGKEFVGTGKYVTDVDNDNEGELFIVRTEQGSITQFGFDEIKSIELIKK